jgi:hypothetical protein
MHQSPPSREENARVKNCVGIKAKNFRSARIMPIATLTRIEPIVMLAELPVKQKKLTYSRQGVSRRCLFFPEEFHRHNKEPTVPVPIMGLSRPTLETSTLSGALVKKSCSLIMGQ